MLILYHGANSVCSIKVRLVLHEKQLDWRGRHIDLPKGEQFSEAFLAVNPRAIVPVLDHDGRLIGHQEDQFRQRIPDSRRAAPGWPS